MRRFLPRWRFGTCLLVAVLACGCQHNRCCCTPCDDAPSAVTMGAPVAVTWDEEPAATEAVNSGETPPARPALPPDTNASTEIAQFSPASYQKATTAAPAAASSPSGPRFGHDANYRWLVGTLDYSRIQQAWLLRYVPVEEEDRYGGCVTLEAPSHVLHFKRGQTVRVEGSLIDPESRQLRPAFEVRNIRAEEP